MKITFNVAGFREVDQALSGLKKSVSRKVMRDSLTAGGEITAQVARSLAPVDEGGLRESIHVSSRLSARQKAKHNKVSEVEVFIGPKGSPKSIVQEFGSIEQLPQPYMRPAWDRTHRQVLMRVADEVMVRVDAAVARAAKVKAKV